MYTFLVILISLLAVLLIVIILLQSGKGGGLAATFGGASSSTESFMGGRQAANVLTRLTWAGGGVFLFLALVLAVLSSRAGSAPESILQEGLGPATQVPEAPTSVLESEGILPQPAGEDTGAVPEGAGDGGEDGGGGSGG